jgi:RNA polymerase sigma factor (sigma-70 family)
MIAELEELYRAKRPDFCRVAAAIAGERSLGEDAVQDAFAKAVRKRRSYRGRGSLEAWVWRIVVNAARDARRRRPLVVAPNELRLTETNGRSDGRAVPPTAPLHRGRLGGAVWIEPHPALQTLWGRLTVPAARVEVDLSSGSTLHLPVVENFFLASLSKDDRVTEIRAYDDSGAKVATARPSARK